jgi:hypothetical protein
MHTCIPKYMHACIHEGVLSPNDLQTCVQVWYICMYTCLHTCIPKYMHTCIHAYMHTWKWAISNDSTNLLRLSGPSCTLATHFSYMHTHTHLCPRSDFLVYYLRKSVPSPMTNQGLVYICIRAYMYTWKCAISQDSTNSVSVNIIHTHISQVMFMRWAKGANQLVTLSDDSTIKTWTVQWSNETDSIIFGCVQI